MIRPRVFYEVLEPNKIFGMVGRCGGGYNTVWADWSDEGRIAREHIMREYEEGLDKICGHYDKLEQSVLSEGFRNPVIITCGYPQKRKMEHLPPELRSKNPSELFLLEGVTGGSRLWVAQKYNIPVPCIINDFTGRYRGKNQVLSTLQAKKYFKDPPAGLRIDRMRGCTESYDNTKASHHLEEQWTEDKIVVQRAPLWVSTMNKYGYYVERLQPFVLEILRNAGVVQPPELRFKHNGRNNI